MHVSKHSNTEDIAHAIFKLKRHQAELASQLDEYEHILKKKLVEEGKVRGLKLDYTELRRTYLR